MASSGQPRIGALLLNWRRADLTERCLLDLLASTGPALHVLVIDNGSGDDSAERLRRAVAAAPVGRHRATFAGLPENLGFTGGMNHGFRWAAGQGLPYALVLNNDLQLPPDFAGPLAAVLDHDPRIAAVGPTVLHPDGSVWAEGGRTGFAPNALRLCGHGGPPRPRTAGPEPVEFLPCACVLFRTEAVQAVGGFDDRYFMYWEDVDLCARLRDRGGRIVWLPWVPVVHAAGQSSGGGRSPLRKFLMANNALRYLRARGSFSAWAAWFCFDVLGWPLVLGAGPAAAFAKLRGTLAGLRGHRASAADVAHYLRGR